MVKKPNQIRWIIALGVVVLLAILIRSTLQATHAEYEVCMAFKGGSHCASATGASQGEASSQRSGNRLPNARQWPRRDDGLPGYPARERARIEEVKARPSSIGARLSHASGV